MVTPSEKKILVVDDEPDVRLYLQTVLVDAGFQVETACDGYEALEMFEANPPDAVSLDLVMPRKSGAKFLYEYHKHDEWSRIPVILVTAHAKDDLGKEDFDEIMANRSLVGPETYLEKPVKPLSYVNSFKRALGIEITEAPDSKEETKDAIKGLLNNADPQKMDQILNLLKQK